MKKFLAAISFFLSAYAVQAQNPVNWTFTSKKVADRTFELHLTADIDAGWHIYSQDQPKDAIAIPTSVTITSNPLLRMDGKVKEVGKMEKYLDKTLNIPANQYSERVDFVQVVKLKANAKTNVSGTVEFQTCNDKKCLPPKTVPFNVSLK